MQLGKRTTDFTYDAQKAVADAIEARLRTGRPLAAEEWILAQEQALGYRLGRMKPGRKPARKASDAKSVYCPWNS